MATRWDISEFDVSYATNAPAARAWLDRTSTDDLVLGAAELLWGVLSGIGLLPIAGIWTFPAMVWVVAFFVASGQEEMKRAPTKIGFAIAIVIYVGVKILLLPGLFRGTPLLQLVPSAWAAYPGDRAERGVYVHSQGREGDNLYGVLCPGPRRCWAHDRALCTAVL